MNCGDPQVLGLVRSILSRQQLRFEEEEKPPYFTKVRVQRGAQKAAVNVFNTSKISVDGPQTSLRQLLEQMKQGIEAGDAGPGQALPFEIDAFPDTIRQRVPDCDPIIIRFVDEAIRCYKADAMLATAFMIGAASERAINILIHEYADSIQNDDNRQKLLARLSGRQISKKYEVFEASYKSCKSRPTDPYLANDLEVVIGNMFQFCRITRNEIGHPQVVPDLDRGVQLANLGHFVTYIERIYGLVGHFQTNGVVV